MSGGLLISQLEFYWDVHLRPRLDGLTDAEYLWAPAEPSWTVHPDATGKVVIDHGDPVLDPPPITTIAWRMVHIGVGCFAIRWNAFFGDGPADADMFDPRQYPSELPGTADAGIEFLDDWYGRWMGAIKGLDEDGLNEPLGPKGNIYAKDSMLALITHLNREVMHHGGEICLLRDLYRAGVGR